MYQKLKIRLWTTTFLMLSLIQVVKTQGVENLKFHKEQFTFIAENGKEVKAEKGILLVPENRSNSKSRLIPINFVRFRSISKNPGSPIVYLAGGPGSSGIQTARRSFSLFMALREVSDVIVFDQRGTGDQSMVCPDKIFLPMDMSNIVSWLLPKEKKFFLMLKDQASNVVEGSNEFKNLIDNYNNMSKAKKEEFVKRIKNIEGKGDN
ncbi:MAG: hypothetical protein IH949_11980, partial [Bacteroidetes bacterium]|nr:hypothetical protein [Bacteroidota bacterium]